MKRHLTSFEMHIRIAGNRDAVRALRIRKRGLVKAVLSILVLLTAMLGAANPVIAADSDSPVSVEYQIKAAFLYRFIKFIEWPDEVLPDTQRTITIGVLGESPMNKTLQSIEGREVKGHKLAIKRFGGLQDLESCDVLFIGRPERDSDLEESLLRQALSKLKGTSTLTVSEIEGFAQLGGIINFIIVENKVRFEINLKAARDANLKISSKLLRLARIVRES